MHMPLRIAITAVAFASVPVSAKPLIDTLPVDDLCRYTQTTLPESERQIDLAWRWQATRVRFNRSREQCQMQIIVEISADALYRQIVRDLDGALETREQTRMAVDTRGYRKALSETLTEFFEYRFRALDTDDRAFSIDLRAHFTNADHAVITQRLFTGGM